MLSVGIAPPTPKPRPAKTKHRSGKEGANADKTPKMDVTSSVKLNAGTRPLTVSTQSHIQPPWARLSRVRQRAPSEKAPQAEAPTIMPKKVEADKKPIALSETSKSSCTRGRTWIAMRQSPVSSPEVAHEEIHHARRRRLGATSVPDEIESAYHLGVGDRRSPLTLSASQPTAQARVSRGLLV